MDFFDELDAAFDHMLSAPKQVAPEAETEPDAISLEATRLKTEIADVQSTGVHALLNLLDQLPRIPVLTAIHGSLKHLAIIDPVPHRLTTVQNMIALLETLRGTIRRRLTRPQRVRLGSMIEVLNQSNEKDMAAAKTLLTALAHQRAMCANEYHGLYLAGIWRAEQFESGSADQLAMLSGIGVDRIRDLKEAIGLG